MLYEWGTIDETRDQLQLIDGILMQMRRSQISSPYKTEWVL